ncbi:PIG-L family deacetylase [Corynebacterium lizhenjunii]|uniref:PIG-L family deacetylase n=1 Tax=Corynebacterium lizhenjunii TaxID=2709394 RepID=UPI0013E9A150|nr:PIG-L family deacetylase [Corynebacterium lizhenjunii]
MEDLSRFRVLAVHAHPDDEVLFTGGTLADMAHRGAQVRVVTATLGEEGEVIGSALQGLVASGLLGGYRARELADAVAALGVESRLLGGLGCFRDSGMAGPAHPRALVNRVEEATAAIAREVADFAPHIVLTYGPDGGYGHRDHIAVHRAVHAAVPAQQRVWWAVFDRESNYAGLEREIPQPWRRPSTQYLDNFTNVAQVRYALPPAALTAKLAAMKAHSTQIWLQEEQGAYALSNELAMPVLDAEFYQPGQACTLEPGLSGAELLLAGVE